MTLRAIPLCLAGGLLMLAAEGAFSAPATAAAAKSSIVAMKGDPVAGGRLYQACVGCHSLDENEVGPKHRGVVGRRAGSVPGYVYSPALKSSGIVWTSQTIDRWLTNPQKLVPGAKMYFSVARPQDRADIIAYLALQR